MWPKKIKSIRSDRGGEYGPPSGQFSLEHDIVHQTTAPYSSQSNGIVGRKNWTLKKMMNSMLYKLRFTLKFVGRSFVNNKLLIK